MDASDWVGTDKGRALDFDGVNDYVIIPDSDALDITSRVSFGLWVKGSSSANRVLMEKGGNGSLLLQPNNSDQMYFYSGTTVETAAGISSSIFNGNWNYLVVVYDGTTATLYRNGSILASRNATAVTANSSSLVIGARNGGSVAIACQVDDIRIYNRVLSPSEIKQLYEGGPGYGLRQERKRSRFAITVPPRKRSSRFLSFPA
jgi:hypothetical protein